MVKFCEICSNLYIHQLNDKGQLMYVCHMCGHTESVTESCLMTNSINNKIADYHISINMIHDHTLLRTRKLVCPNPECPNQKTSERPEIIIFQYNPTMLKHGYMCQVCHTYWKI